MEKINLIQCWSCRKEYPKDFFKPLPEGWYSRSGVNYSCRFCSLDEEKYPVKYNRIKGKLFDRLIPYEPSWDERMSDFFYRRG